MPHVTKIVHLVCIIILSSLTWLQLPARATAQDPLDLSQKYTSTDNRLSFSYPATFFAESRDGIILIVNSPLLLMTNQINPGDIIMNVLRPEILDPVYPNIGQDLDAYFSGLMVATDYADKTSDPVAVTVGEYPALLADTVGTHSRGNCF